MATGDTICAFCRDYAYPTDSGPHHCPWMNDVIPGAQHVFTLKEFRNLKLDKDGNVEDKPLNLGQILRNKAEVAADAKVNEAFTKIVAIIHDEAAAGLVESRVNMKVMKLTDDFSINLLVDKLRNEGLTCQLIVSETAYQTKAKNLLIKW